MALPFSRSPNTQGVDNMLNYQKLKVNKYEPLFILLKLG